MLIHWGDVNARYPESAKYADATQADSSHVLYAVKEIEARLASRFTVPFSSNNITARDLAIDNTMAKLFLYKDPEKAEALKTSINERIDALLGGNMDMILDDGTIMVSGIADLIYSTTEDHHPVFGLSPVELSVVDSGEIISEEAARGRFY